MHAVRSDSYYKFGRTQMEGAMENLKQAQLFALRR